MLGYVDFEILMKGEELIDSPQQVSVAVCTLEKPE
jgi:hypothetical protein